MAELNPVSKYACQIPLALIYYTANAVFQDFLSCGFCSFNYRQFLNKNSLTVVKDTEELIYPLL